MGFTDDKIKLFDMRMKGDDFSFELEGSHSNTVRSVKISDDGMTCYSIGADNTLRVWDMA
jgi:WD40 repeat protein